MPRALPVQLSPEKHHVLCEAGTELGPKFSGQGGMERKMITF
jgi:hypothetical protein